MNSHFPTKTHFFGLVCMMAGIVFLAGCASNPLPTPSPTPTTLATIVPVPSATQPIAPTPTIAPSATRTPLTLFQGSPCGRCAAPQLVMDAQGTLHLFWRAGGDSNIGFAQMKPGGTWVKQPLDMNYANESYYIFNTAYQLIRHPNGQACVMANGMNFKTNEHAMLIRCFDGTAWRDTYTTSPTSCVYAFAPDGTVRSLDSQKLSPNLGAIFGDCKLTIDRNGGYHALWWAQDTNSVWYRFSADKGNTWSAAEKFASEYPVPDLRVDAQGNLYYWTKTTYRRWMPNLGWQAPVDLRRYVNFDQYGIGEIKRLAPAPNGRLRALIGTATGAALYYVEQIVDDKWSEPVLITQYSVNADLVIDDQGVSHIAYDQWGDVYYATMGAGK